MLVASRFFEESIAVVIITIIRLQILVIMYTIINLLGRALVNPETKFTYASGGQLNCCLVATGESSNETY